MIHNPKTKQKQNVPDKHGLTLWSTSILMVCFWSMFSFVYISIYKYIFFMSPYFCISSYSSCCTWMFQQYKTTTLQMQFNPNNNNKQKHFLGKCWSCCVHKPCGKHQMIHNKLGFKRYFVAVFFVLRRLGQQQNKKNQPTNQPNKQTNNKTTTKQKQTTTTSTKKANNNHNNKTITTKNNTEQQQ